MVIPRFRTSSSEFNDRPPQLSEIHEGETIFQGKACKVVLTSRALGVVRIHKQQLVFMVRFRPVTTTGAPNAIEVHVWRDIFVHTALPATSVTKFVMFDLLLRRFEVIASHPLETHGLSFWAEMMVSTAKNLGLNVTLADSSGIHSIDGTNPVGKRVVISARPQ